MDYEAYRRAFIPDPQPEPRFAFAAGAMAMALYYEDLAAAVDYFSAVLGPPNYKEEMRAISWFVGSGGLTLLPGKNGNPTNVELGFVTKTVAEAERLHRAFIDAGGKGEDPIDTLMFVPVRFCAVTDPFGVQIIITCPTETG